jgi:hypothetical protein
MGTTSILNLRLEFHFQIEIERIQDKSQKLGNSIAKNYIKVKQNLYFFTLLEQSILLKYYNNVIRQRSR